MKLFILLVVFISSLFSQSYNFTETRYSDAFGRSMHLQGIIYFEKNSLKINYKNDKREILYKDSILGITQDGKALSIHSNQQQSMRIFFEVLLMIYNDDQDALAERFTLTQEENKTLLNPIGDLSQYIEKVTLVKQQEELKEVALFLKNADHITISIENEIR